MKWGWRMVAIGVAATALCGWFARVASPLAAQEQTPSPVSDPETQPPDADKAATAHEKKTLPAAKAHIARLKLQLGGLSGDLIGPVDRPLMAFGDPTRAHSHGTLWAFGASGRPDAVMKLWQGSENQAIWYQSFIRTGDRHVLLQSPDGRRWQPPNGTIARTILSDASPPSASGPGRFRQTKSLAMRFTAHEIGDPDRARAELRLLVQPIHRYDDPDHAIQDGAAFLFAHGTNPEIILLIEALGATIDQARWHYSAFATSSAELHVELDGREVWMRPGAPGVVGRPADDYWLFSLPAEVASDDDAPDESP